jgi:hypothetical protein
MEKLLCESPDDFESSFSSAEQLALSNGKSLFILFTGTKNPDTGKIYHRISSETQKKQVLSFYFLSDNHLRNQLVQRLCSRRAYY